MPKCSKCKHNPMGTCKLTGKEVPIAYVLNRINKCPKWCPISKEK